MLVDGIAHIAGLSWRGPSWIQTIWRCSKGLHFKIHTWNNEDLVSPISYVSSSFFMPNKWFFFVTPVDYGHVAWWGMEKTSEWLMTMFRIRSLMFDIFFWELCQRRIFFQWSNFWHYISKTTRQQIFGCVGVFWFYFISAYFCLQRRHLPS